MYGHRVVVTGLGCISPIGLSVDEYWQNLLGGVSGDTATVLRDAADAAKLVYVDTNALTRLQPSPEPA